MRLHHLRLVRRGHGYAAIGTFSIRRFKWPEHPQLKFAPSVGHLLAGASKRITATFLSATPVRLEGQELRLQVVQVRAGTCTGRYHALQA